MNPFLFHIDSDRRRAVHSASIVTGLSMAEVIRRMISHSTNIETLNEIFPHCSGSAWDLTPTQGGNQ